MILWQAYPDLKFWVRIKKQSPISMSTKHLEVGAGGGAASEEDPPPSSPACRGTPGRRAPVCSRRCPSGCRCGFGRPAAPARPPASASLQLQTPLAVQLTKKGSHPITEM